MRYLKVYTNFRRSMQDLTDDEKGRLFDAMLSYVETGEEPVLTGNERFIWGSVLNMFDAQTQFNEKQRANGLKGGRPKTQEKPEEPKETQEKPEKPKRKEKKRKENNTPTEYLKENPLEAAMQEFREHRKAIKAPLNELSEKKIRNELERLTHGDEEQKIQILDQSIRNGWKGVFSLKDDRRRNYAEHQGENLDHLLVNLDEVTT